jgi:hypothetical protein
MRISLASSRENLPRLMPPPPKRYIDQLSQATLIASKSMRPPRRFPPPWPAEVTPNCFIVRDANGQALSYVYYESEPGWNVSSVLAVAPAWPFSDIGGSPLL